MNKIHISAWQEVPNYANTNVSQIVSINDAGMAVPNLSNFKRDFNYRRFTFKDLSSPQDDAPTVQNIRNMILHFYSIKENEEVLFHCMAGISRSPAAAFIFLVIKGMSYQDAYKEITKVRGYTQPNMLMIKYADAILKHDGKMLKFVAVASGREHYT